MSHPQSLDRFRHTAYDVNTKDKATASVKNNVYAGAIDYEAVSGMNKQDFDYDD